LAFERSSPEKKKYFLSKTVFPLKSSSVPPDPKYSRKIQSSKPSFVKIAKFEFLPLEIF